MNRIRPIVWAGMAALLIAVGASSQEMCRASERTMDERRQIVLENRFVQLTIEPEAGGQVVRFRSKSGNVEFVRPGLGMLQDRFWQVPNAQSPWLGAYQAHFQSNTPQRIALVLSRDAEGDWKYHRIEKTLTLTADSPVVKVDYSYRVSENRMSASTIAPWVVNGFSVSGEENKLILPLTEGLYVLDYNPTAPPMHQQFSYTPARGWLAAAGQKSQAGLAVTLDYSRLMAFYLWFGNNKNTMEWMYNTFSVPHGQALTSSHELIPFRGLTNVAGVGGGVVAQLDVPEKADPAQEVPVAVKLYNGQAGPLRVVLAYEKLPGRLAEKSETRTLDIPVDAAQGFTLTWTPAEAGTYAIHGQVFRGAEKVCDFERPLRVGNSTEAYALLPLTKRLGSPEERFGVRTATLRSQDIPTFEFKDDVVTPHVKWGTPYYRGPLRVFFITDQSQGRDIIELKQRLQIEPIVPLAIVNKRSFVGDNYANYTEEMAAVDLTARLKKKDFDVIVVGGGCLIWTEEHRRLIADLVKSGVGLVWIGAPTPEELKDFLPLDAKNPCARAAWADPDDPRHSITRLMPLSLLPQTVVATGAAMEGAQVLARAGGRPLIAVTEKAPAGRVAQMNYATGWSDSIGSNFAGITPYDQMYAREPYPYWEYWYSLVGRAILWAGRFDAPLQPAVTSVAYVPGNGPLPSVDLVVDLEGKAEGLAELTVEMVLRGPYAEELYRETKPWAGQPLRFSSEKLMTGRLFADIRLLAQDKVVAWGTHGFLFRDGPVIKEVKLEKGADSDVFIEGDEVAASVALDRNDGCQVVTELYDGLDRLLARQSAPAQGTQRVAVRAVRPLHPGGQLVVTIEKNGRTLAEQRAFVTVLPAKMASRAWDDYVGIVWGQIGAYQKMWTGRAKADIMRQMGYTVHNAIPMWAPMDMTWPLRLGMQPLAMSVFHSGHDDKNDEAVRKEYARTGDKMLLVRRPSLSDPAYQEEAKAKCREAVSKVKQYRPFAYNFGDEVSYAPNGLDYDFSGFALKEFRAWLSTQYPNIAALNAEWQAEFKSFDEAIPFTSKEAVNSERYAPWADLRLFAGYSVAKFHEMLITEMKKEDPQAFYGLSGTQVPYPYNGMDWALLAPVFSYHSNYWGGGELPLLHADFSPQCRLAEWNGYGPDKGNKRLSVWQRYLWNQAGLSYYEQFCMLNPDLRPSRIAQEIALATKDIRTGLAKLLLNSTVLKDRVAIYYSMPSILGTTITGRGDMKDNRYGWLWAILDCGMQPRYVSYLDVRTKGLSRDDFDVLVLPGAMALSPEEALAIKAFAEAGGTVLADTVPGVLSGHCRILPQGALDGLFGVKQDGAYKDEKASGDLKIAGTAFGLTLGESTQGTTLASGKVRLAGGQALGLVGEVPAYVVNRAGKGKALYFNTGMHRYLELRAGGKEAEMRERMRMIFAWAGAKQAVAVTTPDGQPIDKAIVYRHRNGEASVVSCVLDNDKDLPAKVVFPKEGNVYNVRTGKHLGEGTTFSVTLPGDDALVLAWLPYTVKSVKCTPVTVKAGNEASLAVALDTDGKPAAHVVRLEVSDPAGKARDDLAQNVLLAEGRAVAKIPFALNDAPGDYKVVLRDVSSGVRGETTLTVQRAP